LRRSDAELMVLVREGDEEAFIEIVERYKERLLNFFYHLSWDYHMSEDLAQEVFMRLYAARKRYRTKASFRAFIYSIARNLWIDFVRKRKPERVPVSLDTPVGRQGGEGTLRDMIPDERSEHPGSCMEREEMARIVKDAVDGLSREERLVVMLVMNEGLKYREVAEVLGIPEGSVKSRMSHAYRVLRAKLKRYV